MAKRPDRSALLVDSINVGDWKREADLTPEERERGEAWRRFRDQPRLAAAFVSTTGESKAEIVHDMADAMRRAGLLKRE